MAKIPYSEFVEGLDAAAALDGTEPVVVLQGGVPVESTTQDIADLGGASYLKYVALLTQIGTDAPVATVLENTLGGTVVWTYGGTGEYLGTLAGAFTAGKVFISLTLDEDLSNGYTVRAFADGTDAVQVNQYDGSFAAVDQMGLYIEVRVYP